MGAAISGLMSLLGIVGFVCFIIIVIDAFKNAVWKGIVAFFCFLYAIYYAIVEFQHEKKPLIVAGFLIPLALNLVLYFVVMSMVVAAVASGSASSR